MAATGSNEDIPAVEVTGPARINTLWGSMLRDNAKMIIPDLDVLVDYPIDYRFPAFGRDKQGQLVGSGFFPAEPVVLHPVPKTPWSIRAELFFPARDQKWYLFILRENAKDFAARLLFQASLRNWHFFAQNPFHSKSEIHESEIFKSIAQKNWNQPVANFLFSPISNFFWCSVFLTKDKTWRLLPFCFASSGAATFSRVEEHPWHDPQDQKVPVKLSPAELCCTHAKAH